MSYSFARVAVKMRILFARQICSKNGKPAVALRKTIYAQSSAPGRAAVSVIRISGPQAADCLKSLIMSDTLPKARYATLKKIWNPITKILIDRGLVLWFPGPASYTGEDSFEIHSHGSLAVQFSLYEALESMEDVRLADAGEFTRRAFHNNKLDLTEVEGLCDLLHAETEAQRKQAVAQSMGALQTKFKGWQEMLASQIMTLEAEIDFSEADNLRILRSGLYKAIEVVIQDMQQSVEESVCAERVLVGCRTAIVGEPNTGKSSLLNSITQQNMAIVSSYAGTTTDVIEASLDMGGYPVTLCDTAGLNSKLKLIRLRAGRDLTLAQRLVRRMKRQKTVAYGNPYFIEQEGMQRARAEIRRADLLLVVVDCQAALEYVWRLDGKVTVSDYMNHYYEALIKAPEGSALLDNDGDKAFILIFNKIDLVPKKKRELFISTGYICVSSKTGEGMDVLQKLIVEKVENLCGGARCASPRLCKKRHVLHVKEALHYLTLFQTASHNPDRSVLVAALNSAIEELQGLTGDSYKESLLDGLFGQFCIGK